MYIYTYIFIYFSLFWKIKSRVYLYKIINLLLKEIVVNFASINKIIITLFISIFFILLIVIF